MAEYVFQTLLGSASGVWRMSLASSHALWRLRLRELNDATLEIIYRSCGGLNWRETLSPLKARDIADPVESEKEEAATGFIEQERGLTEFPGARAVSLVPPSQGLLQFDLWEEHRIKQVSKIKRTSLNTVCGTVCLWHRMPANATTKPEQRMLWTAPQAIFTPTHTDGWIYCYQQASY